MSRIDRSPNALRQASPGPLALAAHGSFWTGIQTTPVEGGTAIRGQTYVEYWVPEELRYETPLVFIHGGGGQGLDYLVTADGREGWAKYFLRCGFPVYVLDRPGHGRSPFASDAQGSMPPSVPAERFATLFTSPERTPEVFPTAYLHDKWIGEGVIGDPRFDAVVASMGPTPGDRARHYLDCRRGGAELLDEIGRSILLTHSAGGPVGWLIADIRPDLVAGILAVEPMGPPFRNRGSVGGGMEWGLTAAPMEYSPVTSPAELAAAFSARDRDMPKLVNLRNVPVMVATANASIFAGIDVETVRFLRGAGVSVEHLKLDEVGLRGYGHFMMLERDSEAIAAALKPWLSARAKRP